MDESIFEKRKAEEQERFDKLLAMRGTENAYKLHRELGEIMTANVTVVRENEKLLETDKKIVELMKRYEDIDMEDTQTWSNQADLVYPSTMEHVSTCTCYYDWCI